MENLLKGPFFSKSDLVLDSITELTLLYELIDSDDHLLDLRTISKWPNRPTVCHEISVYIVVELEIAVTYS